MSVSETNSPSHDYSHPGDQTTQTTETSGIKPLTGTDINDDNNDNIGGFISEMKLVCQDNQG